MHTPVRPHASWWRLVDCKTTRTRTTKRTRTTTAAAAPHMDVQTCSSTQVVAKLGLLDTSRTAWESDEHDVVWKGLKAEFELESRFENLLKKVVMPSKTG